MNASSVGLVIAMSAEARALTGNVQPTRQVVRLSPDVFLRVGGVGAKATEQSCAALLEAGADALIGVGCAAGLAAECLPGAVVVAEEVRTERGEIIPTDEAWRTALVAGLGSRFNPFLGTVAGVDGIIGAEQKRALRARTGALAADMESASIAGWARRQGIPMMALRVVSDGPDDAVPPSLLDSVDAFGRPRYGALLAALARRPKDALALARLRGGFNQACRALSRVSATTGLTFCLPRN